MIFETLINSELIFDVPLIAEIRGVSSILPLIIPTILDDFPCSRLSTAITPIFVPKTLSKHDGEPPLCMCPKTETLIS